MARLQYSPAIDEHALLHVAQDTEFVRSNREVSSDLVRALSAEVGIDMATALLYQRIRQSAEHRLLIDEIDAFREQPASPKLASPPLLAIAPGAFYREFPHAGADGRLLRREAEALGMDTVVIPARSTGGIAENANTLLDWLDAQPSRPLVLASVSKGGSDIKQALTLPRAARAFRNVVAWINVCGILDGSPMVDWLLARRWRTLFYRALFRMRRYSFRVIEDLHAAEGGLRSLAWKVPPELPIIHVLGFPLTTHMTNRLTRTFRQRIAGYGPNDGCIVLANAWHWPGGIYPVWGADHYMRPGWGLRSLARALFQFVASGTLRAFPKP